MMSLFVIDAQQSHCFMRKNLLHYTYTYSSIITKFLRILIDPGGEIDLIFISLGKMRKKPSKEMSMQATNVVDEIKKIGIKIIGWYWTLGRYDTAFIFEAENEKEALKVSLAVAEFVSTETLVAIPREEAIKLL